MWERPWQSFSGRNPGGCTGGEGRTEYYVTERSAAFDETVRIMDQTVDPSSIRVETDFLG